MNIFATVDDKKFSYSDSEVRELAIRCYSRLKSFIISQIGGGKQMADDILQEAFCKLLSSRPEVDADRIDGYLFKIVRNLCINCRTRMKKTESLESETAVSAWNILSAADFENKEASELPETDVIKVIRAAEKFNSPMKEIFRLTRIEGMTHEEAARQMGISERTVENYLHKSVVLLKRDFPKTIS